MGFVTSGERRSAKQAYGVWAVLSPKTDGEHARLDRVITTQLTKVNALLKAAGQPQIVRTKTEGPAPRPVTP